MRDSDSGGVGTACGTVNHADGPDGPNLNSRYHSAILDDFGYRSANQPEHARHALFHGDP